MESPEALLINGVSESSLDGGLTKSLLDSASLSSARDNNSSNTASVSFGLDEISTLDTAVASFSSDSLQPVANFLDNSLLFQQSSLTASVPSQPLSSNLTNNSTTGFDSLTGRMQDASLVSFNSNDPLSDSLISVGKFGDFDGQQDFQLTIKDALGNPETFSLVGDGMGEVFRNSSFEQIIFTSTDASTIVQISAFNNIKFGDYLGSSLSVQTNGSITAGNITLKNTTLNNPGLSLRSGLSDVQNSSTPGSSYSITDLGNLPGDNYSYAYGINDSGQVVGFSSNNHAFLYSDGKMTDLGSLPRSGYDSSAAYGINNSGQIVGDSKGRAFLYSDAKMTDLGILPGYDYSRAYSINDSGQVVGFSGFSTFSQGGFYYPPKDRAFLYSDGQMIDLGTLPGKTDSYAYGINNSGQIVGTSGKHAFLYSDGQMIDLGTLPGNSYSSGWDINDSGQIVGDSGEYAFLYSDGKMTNLGTLPGDSGSYAYGINNSGQVIGGSYTNDSYHIFLYSDGKMTDLNSLIPEASGWTLVEVTAINNKGQIVGYGNIGGQEHAFLLDPISTSTATPKDGITVGNISTLGGNILLQGLKINLTGDKVVSKGGNITLDGPTILNSSTGAYTFSSAKSSATSKGGDITFKNTVDGFNAGTSSLNLTAGQGNIILDKAIGSNAALKDLTINSAKTVTIKGDVTTTNDITLNAIDDIATASLSTSDTGKVSISLGIIGSKKYDSKGNVTTSDITSKQIYILSDGAFRTNSDIQTKDGDVNIIALKEIAVHNITSTNAGISLISATNAITATGEIIGDYGVTGLAKQNITTDKIQSANDVVLLNSSQGAVTVNGAITSNSNVSLSAFKDVVTQDITSLDGAVALISSSGNVNAQGAISSVDNVTVGATKDVVAQNIVSAFGTVALISSKSNVTTTEINSGSQVAIQADQNVTTGKISSQWGKVALIAKQGTVTTQGDITTNNGEVYLSSVGDVISQNIISNGGLIAITSSQGAVTTGYLRSDGNDTGGKIYVQAEGSVRVIGFVSINNINYSIYTGINKKGLISIAYENSVLKSNKSKFVIGDASINGTAASIYGPYALKDEPPNFFEILKDTTVIFYRIIEEIFRGNDNQPTKDPSKAADTNPITGKAYSSNKKERELVEQLNTAQQRRLNVLIHDKNNSERITEQEVFTKGKVETDHGCFNLELDRHLGDAADNSKPELGKDITHSLYATYVTGAPGDYLVITSSGLSAFYDGLVRAKGAIVKNGLKPPGSVAEVKTGYRWLKKYLLLPGDSNYIPPTEQEKFIFRKMISQIDREAEVAKDCGLQYFMCFSNKEAGLAAREMFEYKQPPRTKNSVPVHYLKLPIFTKEQP
ncbi:hypothetical protein H6G04_27785 [Calothrix membranacea FACHB-236]|nr:hypothetical protein [Calothrix membranacea FACHB-236]